MLSLLSSETARSMTAWSASQRATRRTPFIRLNPLMWLFPCPLKPMTATRMSSFAPWARVLVENMIPAPAAAEPARNPLRVILLMCVFPLCRGDPWSPFSCGGPDTPVRHPVDAKRGWPSYRPIPRASSHFYPCPWIWLLPNPFNPHGPSRRTGYGGVFRRSQVIPAPGCLARAPPLPITSRRPMTKTIVKIAVLCLLVAGGSVAVYRYEQSRSAEARLQADVKRLEQQRQHLQDFVSRLTSEKRVAEILVTDQTQASGHIEST